MPKDIANHINELILIDDASSTVTYIGYAGIGDSTSDAKWKIKKISVSGTITTINFADGTASYINIWDNRTGYTYS